MLFHCHLMKFILAFLFRNLFLNFYMFSQAFKLTIKTFYVHASWSFARRIPRGSFLKQKLLYIVISGERAATSDCVISWHSLGTNVFKYSCVTAITCAFCFVSLKYSRLSNHPSYARYGQ